MTYHINRNKWPSYYINSIGKNTKALELQSKIYEKLSTTQGGQALIKKFIEQQLTKKEKKNS